MRLAASCCVAFLAGALTVVSVTYRWLNHYDPREKK